YLQREVICRDRIVPLERSVFAFEDEDIIVPGDKDIVLELLAVPLELERLRRKPLLFKEAKCLLFKGFALSAELLALVADGRQRHTCRVGVENARPEEKE